MEGAAAVWWGARRGGRGGAGRRRGWDKETWRTEECARWGGIVTLKRRREDYRLRGQIEGAGRLSSFPGGKDGPAKAGGRGASAAAVDVRLPVCVCVCACRWPCRRAIAPRGREEKWAGTFKKSPRGRGGWGKGASGVAPRTKTHLHAPVYVLEPAEPSLPRQGRPVAGRQLSSIARVLGPRSVNRRRSTQERLLAARGHAAARGLHDSRCRRRHRTRTPTGRRHRALPPLEWAS